MSVISPESQKLHLPARAPGRIAVAVVEEHEILRRGLVASLAEDPWFDVAPTPRGAIGQDMDVAVVSRDAARARFACPIIVCSNEPVEFGSNRVAGVLHRGTLTGAQLRASVHAAVAGLQVHHGTGTPQPQLEVRERLVLELMADGLTTREIADRINYSERTVKKLITALAGELGARNRAQLVAHAIREGLI
jgi:DNA-binding CsgD family transcriptional regulator